jgi:hypothetical protein
MASSHRGEAIFLSIQNKKSKTTPCTVAGGSHFNGLRGPLDGMRKSSMPVDPSGKTLA